MTDLAELTGVRMSAILINELPKEDATEIFRLLSKTEVELIVSEILRLGSVTHEETQKALEWFMNEAERHANHGSSDTSRILEALTDAIGEKDAKDIILDINDDRHNTDGLDKLNMMDASSVTEVVHDEHPQIIATILIHIKPKLAGEVMDKFDEGLRNDVMARIANYQGVQPGAFKELKEVLSKALNGHNLKRNKVGGTRAAAEILNTMSGANEESVLQFIEAQNETAAQEIRDAMFLFENLLQLESRAIQRIITEVDTGSLVKALKGADQELIEKFLSNMSTRAREMLKEELDNCPPMRISQVEAEQKAILEVVRRLEASGEIVLSSGEDEFV